MKELLVFLGIKPVGLVHFWVHFTNFYTKSKRYPTTQLFLLVLSSSLRISFQHFFKKIQVFVYPLVFSLLSLYIVYNMMKIRGNLVNVDEVAGQWIVDVDAWDYHIKRNVLHKQFMHVTFTPKAKQSNPLSCLGRSSLN